MGEIIQIRVMAKVHDPEEAKKRWGDLASLAFDMDALQVRAGEDFHLKLVEALHDRQKLGQLPDSMSSQLEKDIQAAWEQKKKLQASLGDWDPGAADRAAYALEDILDQMQQKIAR